MHRRSLRVAITLLALGASGAFAGFSRTPSASAGTGAVAHQWDISAAGWNRSSSPTIADVNGDGIPEIVYGSQDGWVHVRDANGNELPGWPQPATIVAGVASAVDSSPAVADLDNNGKKEIIVSAGSTWAPHQNGGVIVFNADGSVRWRYRADDRINNITGAPPPDGYADGMYSSPAVGDINGDGFPDIVVGGFDQEIHVFDRNGNQFLGNDPFWVYDTVWSSPALYDVSGTGKLDIFIGADQSPGSPLNWAGGVFWDLTVQNGALVPRWRQYTGDVITSSPAIGDLEGNGRKAVVVGSGDYYHHPDGHKVFAWHIDDGSAVPGWPQATGGATSSSPALADLNGDGHLDVIEGSRDGRVYVWHGNGTLMWSTNLPWLNQPGGPVASPIVADVNGDGRPDVIVGNDGELDGLDGRTGAELKTFDWLWSYESSAAVGNFGAAGWKLIGAGFNTPNHTFHVFSVGLPAQATAPQWPMFHHDPQHTGSFDPSPTLSLFSSSSVGLAATSAIGQVRVGGTTPFVGDLVTIGVYPNLPVNGISRTFDGRGYWLVADDGGIFAFNAPFYGSMGGTRLNQPMVGMAPTPSTRGYWMVARDGGIFSFGDAAFYGSTGSIVLNQPVVGMAPTPAGRGYWMVARDGGIFAFGDAGFYGSTGNLGLTDIVGMASSPSGHGYRFVSRSGRVYCFGDAACSGDLAGKGFTIVGMQTSPSGNGYWLMSDIGVVVGFGDVASAAARLPGSAAPLVGISPR